MKSVFLRRPDNTKNENPKSENLKTENEKKSKKSTVSRIENLLFRFFLMSFVALICSQAALLDPSFRSDIVQYKALQGEPLGVEAYLFKTCKMELKLINLDSCPELKVLVNGEEYSVFESDTVLLELKDGDVVELDASRVLLLAEVRINAVSPNIKHLLGNKVSASGGIVPVATVYVSNQ